MNFHERVDESLTAIQAHAVIHVIVENQLALGMQDVAETLSRLVAQGLDRHEAVHAIGTLVTEDAFSLIRSESNEEWDQKRYQNRLEKLTAKRWRKGQY